MALARVSEILKMADKANTSVIAFNSSDYNMIHSVFTIAEELNKPALVMLDPRHAVLWGWGNPEIYAQIAIEEARKVKVPVSFHLDHCMDFDLIMRCIKAGFNLKGYMYWNDADSYEMLDGYRLRFGMTWVDHTTGERVWKKSRHYFSEICKTRMVN